MGGEPTRFGWKYSTAFVSSAWTTCFSYFDSVQGCMPFSSKLKVGNFGGDTSTSSQFLSCRRGGNHAMQLLSEGDASGDLLAADTSFGDQMALFHCTRPCLAAVSSFYSVASSRPLTATGR